MVMKSWFPQPDLRSRGGGAFTFAAWLILSMGAASMISPAQAAGRVIVSATGPYEEFTFRDPAINDNGTVASCGAFLDRTVIFKSGQSFVDVTRDLDRTDGFSNVTCNNLTINNSGRVVFLGSLNIEGDQFVGLFDGPNPDLSGGIGGDNVYVSTVSSSDGGGIGWFDQNNLGDVVWVQPVPNTFGSSIDVRTGNTVDTIAVAPGGADRVQVNDRKTVVWGSYDLSTDEYLIQTSNFAGTVSTLVRQEELILAVDLNNNDLIAFIAVSPTGGRGVYTLTLSGTVTPIAVEQTIDPQSDFSLINNNFVSINDDGTVFFGGNLAEERGGSLGRLFISSDLTRPYVGRGQYAGDYLIEDIVDLAKDSINRADEVVFSGTVSLEGEFVTGDFLVDDFTTEGPFEPVLVNWVNPAGGSFANESNWSPQVVPSESDLALFDLDADYEVQAGSQSVAQLRIDQGSVTIRGDLQAVSESAASPSIVVEDAGGGVSQTRMNWLGGTMLAFNTSLSGSGQRNAGLVISDPGAQWINSASTMLSRADLSVQAGASFSTQNLDLGDSSSLTVCGNENQTSANMADLSFTGPFDLVDPYPVKLLGNVAVTTATALFDKPVILRAPVANDGAGCAAGRGTLPAPPFLTVSGALTVGQSAQVDLAIQNGGQADIGADLVLGEQAGSKGTVSVSGEASGFDLLSTLAVGGDLIVGRAGSGEVDVDYTQAGQVPEAEVIQVTGTMVLGEAAGSQGDLSCLGSDGLNNLLEVTSGLNVAPAGMSTVALTDCTLSSGPSTVASSDSDGFGLVSLTGSFWGIFVTNAEERLLSIGVTAVEQPDVFATRGTVSLAGDSLVQATRVLIGSKGFLELEAGTVIADVETTGGGIFVEPDPDRCTARGPVPSGANTIDGNLTINNGTLGFAARDAASYGQLQVSGNVDMVGAFVRIDFEPGFAPANGETSILLDVSGSTSIADLTLQYSGLEPGFEYSLGITPEGNVQFEALNDAVGFAADTLFRTGFEGRVQTVITRD